MTEPDSIQQVIERLMTKRAADIETMCERMLVLDRGGVLVIDKPDGAYEVRLTDDVPWGEIHYKREGVIR